MQNFDFRRFFGNNSNSTESVASERNKAKQRRGRQCRIEELESREMLSATPWALVEEGANCFETTQNEPQVGWYATQLAGNTEVALRDTSDSFNDSPSLAPLAAAPDSLKIDKLSQVNFKTIRKQYANLNLTAKVGDYHVIEISAKQLSDANLRDAVTDALNSTQDSLIVLRTTARLNKIVLTGGLFNINAPGKTITIVSLGKTKLTLDGNANSRMFVVSNVNTHLKLGGLTLCNGYANGSSDITKSGGAIRNYGMLTLTKCTFSGNRAESGGGAIYNYSSTGSNATGILTASNCKFLNNTAADAGGALYNTRTATLENCTIRQNHANTGRGGGIYCKGSLATNHLNLYDCIITDNRAKDCGGGICNENGDTDIQGGQITNNYSNFGGGICQLGGWLFIGRCNISTNTAVGSGGGIYVNGSTYMSITNSVIESNYANHGGGIYATADNPNQTQYGVHYSRISFNSATYVGGGIWIGTSDFTISNSIIAANLADTNGGGGIYANGSYLTVTRTEIVDNTADGIGGGAFLNLVRDSSFEDTIIAGNQAGLYGGGIYVNTANPASATLTNVTIAGNHAKTGGGIYNSWGTTKVTNSIIAENTNSSYKDDDVWTRNDPSTLTRISYSLIGNTSTNGGKVFINDGSLSDRNPLFVGGLAKRITLGKEWAWTLRLRTDSPAIGMGANFVNGVSKPTMPSQIKKASTLDTITLSWAINRKNPAYEYEITCTSDWGVEPMTVRGNKQVVFTNLDPGRPYKFSIVAVNADGVMSKAMKVTVKTKR